MADWKRLGIARELNVPDEQLERIAPILESLDKNFREIAAGLPDELGMAVDFGADQR